jgi:hypothetical protein
MQQKGNKQTMSANNNYALPKLINMTSHMAKELVDRDSELRINRKQENRQRFITGAKVAQYRHDMLNGKWLFNHQGLLITDSGEILDGQHRLLAVSGLPDKTSIPMLVSTISDQHPGVLATIDAGKPRDVATQLWLETGLQNSRFVVAAVRAEAVLISGYYRMSGMSAAQIVQLLDMHKKSVETIVAVLGGLRGRPHSSLSGPLALYATFAKGKAIEFAESYMSLENLGATSPVLWLRRGFEKYTRTKPAWHRTPKLSLMTANAIMAYDENKRLDAIPSLTSEAGRKWLMEGAKSITSKVIEWHTKMEQTRNKLRRDRDVLQTGRIPQQPTNA